MSSKLEKEARFEATIFGLLRRQFTHPKPLPKDINLDSQVAIVTGSNVGLGLSASRQLLALGLSHLLMGVRSQEKGDAAAATLRRDFPSAIISVWIVDMTNYDSITTFAKQCESLPRIDITILNAGLGMNTYTVVPSTQYETTLQVNYLSTVLLAILLLPLIKHKKPKNSLPVLTIIGSDAMYGATVEPNSPILPQFQRPEKYNLLNWYSQSKMLLALFVSKLAEHISPDDVVVNLANPGMTAGTNFTDGFPAFMVKVMSFVQRLIGRKLDVGATTYLDACLVQSAESHGHFTSEWTIKPFPLFYYTQEGQAAKERLWEETMEELRFASASGIVDKL